MAAIGHQHILVGIETDPTRYHGENARLPSLLEQGAAEQILAYIAADLRSTFPSALRCSICMPGALFDQAQVLRPQIPVYRALEERLSSHYPAGDFKTGLLAIGASNGEMPLAALKPSRTITPGLLQILPLLLSGSEADLEELKTEMEGHSPDRGQLSASSAGELQTYFQVSVIQARFLRFEELEALVGRQLKHLGLLPLWELLDTAINQPGKRQDVTTPGGLSFKWDDGAVHSFFEPFDWWASHGGGVDRPASGHQLQSAYGNWTREYRRYLATLEAHGIKVCQHLAGLEDSELKDSFLLEESTMTPDEKAMPVTEHSTVDLGTLAVTVVSGNRQINLYPLQAGGLNDLHRFIRRQGYSGDVAYPGRICYDESHRQLIPEALPL
jgi:hypothetical protein